MDNPKQQPETPPVRDNIANWRDTDRPGSGGAVDDGPGSPGETLGTGNAREEDR